MDARERRLNTPPTWKGSVTRAALASAIMFIFLSLITHEGQDRVVARDASPCSRSLLYVPAGYYMELFLFRRRQRKKAEGRAK